MFKNTILATSLLAVSATAGATLVGPFTSGWEILANDDGGLTGFDGNHDRGAGENGEGTAAHASAGNGQKFDAEYLLYKYDATTNVLSIGLQTGFNLVSNTNGGFRSGDLALSFDGGPKYDYEYAFDFGSKVNYQGISSWESKSADTAGFYSVDEWTDATIQYDINGELAMLDGDLVAGGIVNASSYTDYLGVRSYTKTMSIDLTLIGLSTFDVADLDAYWTMSCGNDVVTNKVPEPSVMLLLSTGLIALFGGVAIRRKKHSA